MLVSIVIIRYLYLRSAIHLDNIARARLLEKDNKEWLLKWKDLFTFKKSNTENDSVSNRGNYKSSWWQTFRLNWDAIFRKRQLRTKEALQKEHIDMKNKILSEQKELKEKRIKRYFASNFTEHKQNFYKLCLYLFVLILYIVILLLQLKIEDTYEAIFIRDTIKSKPILFSPSLYSNFEPNTTTSRMMQEDDEQTNITESLYLSFNEI